MTNFLQFLVTFGDASGAGMSNNGSSKITLSGVQERNAQVSSRFQVAVRQAIAGGGSVSNGGGELGSGSSRPLQNTQDGKAVVSPVAPPVTQIKTPTTVNVSEEQAKAFSRRYERVSDETVRLLKDTFKNIDEIKKDEVLSKAIPNLQPIVQKLANFDERTIQAIVRSIGTEKIDAILTSVQTNNTNLRAAIRAKDYNVAKELVISTLEQLVNTQNEESLISILEKGREQATKNGALLGKKETLKDTQYNTRIVSAEYRQERLEVKKETEHAKNVVQKAKTNGIVELYSDPDFIRELNGRIAEMEVAKVNKDYFKAKAAAQIAETKYFDARMKDDRKGNFTAKEIPGVIWDNVKSFLGGFFGGFASQGKREGTIAAKQIGRRFFHS